MKDIKSLLRSFLYAFKGLGWMVAHERNFRIHLTFLGFMSYFLIRFDWFVLSRAESAALIIVSALVLASEMVNTAIEKTNDAATKEHNAAVKVAKDAAAGAVLVFAVSAVFVGIAVLWQPEAFAMLYAHYTQNPLNLVILLIAIILSLIFIFKFDFSKKEKE
ncbi:MAG: diacylglycerol kinase family protein [Clostridia bacterium]|nr:diacylglycerol kinase family protein [Clostridia bacterium]